MIHDSQTTMGAQEVRLATDVDLPRLIEVEFEAGQRFREIEMDSIADDLRAPDDLQRALKAERLWVSTVGDRVVGYVVAEVLDGNAHVAQVSVDPRWSGRRIGASLIRHVEIEGRAMNAAMTTLTTIRDVPWNAPYYLQLGYSVLTSDYIGPELAVTMRRECEQLRVDPDSRCAMAKPNP
jgi:ribosomal protein S18 acetylase RimI-like enzyme